MSVKFLIFIPEQELQNVQNLLGNLDKSMGTLLVSIL
jgi:hypothetical protein